MRAAVATIIVAVLACGLLAGCGGSDAEAPTVARYEPSGEGGDAALLGGVVRIEHGCLVIESDGALHLPIFATTDVRPDGWEDGDAVELGGGFAPGVDATVPDACAGLGLDRFVVAAPE
ncbi:hypothetical protein SAMN04489720_2614 [Agrococcus jejuensis]|uniref:DUF5666 domain-containing protein n=2 Tax=Agrococcus jejuensis TaxID=399736 RepID=A0A1G8FTQ6_9MICO|nr:hypothetical protein SAMN04489720_2614 [Agrococcus jejuensis]